MIENITARRGNVNTVGPMSATLPTLLELKTKAKTKVREGFHSGGQRPFSS